MADEKKGSPHDYEMIQRTVLYQGVFCLARYTLRHRLFNGGWSDTFDREILERSDAVAVLPYDPVHDRVILIEQFRPGGVSGSNSPWLIEIPAGVRSHGEALEELGQREAMEEAGCQILKLHSICRYFVSPGGSTEFLHLFCGKVNAENVSGVHGLKDEHEDIRVINVSADEALAKLYADEIKTSPALIALLWLQLHRRQLQAIWT